MLTVDFDSLDLKQGDWLLDIGCGYGRHAYGAAQLGANVIACDMSMEELEEVKAADCAPVSCVAGDITNLPFEDESFDKIVASEVLEHITNDVQALNELHRVLKPQGILAVTVPAYFPEKICWALSDEYHAPLAEGGHIRIYTRNEIRYKMAGTGFLLGKTSLAHAFHSPYWWLRCLVDPENDENRLVKSYHDFLCWEMMKKPWVFRALERVLNPVLGKSLVVYAKKAVYAREAENVAA